MRWHHFCTALALLGALLLGWGQTRPLLLQNADHLHVSRSMGEILLRGNVKFRHEEEVFTTGQAVWNRTLDQVRCVGGFRYLSPKLELKSQSGLYERQHGRVLAEGAAELRDSLNLTQLYGQQILYRQNDELAEVMGRARLVALEADSSTPGVVVWDTLQIFAERFHFDRRSKEAKAMGGVRLIRGDLLVYCDTGMYRWEAGEMELLGSPRATLGDVKISGQLMRVELDERTLQRIRVEGAAQGVQEAVDRNSNELQFSEVDGDTLEAWFVGKVVKAFEARGAAVGRFYPEWRQHSIDRAEGEFLRLDFVGGEPHRGVVEGEAKTVYYHFNEKALEGRNEAIGDTVHLGFTNRQLESVRLSGGGKGRAATGIYYGEQPQGTTANDNEHSQNSLE